MCILEPMIHGIEFKESVNLDNVVENNDHTYFKFACSTFLKNPIGNLIDIALNL